MLHTIPIISIFSKVEMQKNVEWLKTFIEAIDDKYLVD